MIHLLYDAITAIWHTQLLGVAVGILAARQWQAKQWRLDAEKTEYRELLSTLSRSARCLFNFTLQGDVLVMGAEDQRRSYEADVEARSTIEDRIFIALRIQKENVLERWQLLAAEKDAAKFFAKWKEMHAVLVKLAHKDLDIKK